MRKRSRLSRREFLSSSAAAITVAGRENLRTAIPPNTAGMTSGVRISEDPQSVSAPVAITADSSILIGREEPEALQLAARDLASDLAKVLGRPVPVVQEAQSAARVSIVVAYRANHPTGISVSGSAESALLRVVDHPLPGASIDKAILLAGSDMRGAIYAVYHFSEEFAGVDPFYFWTDHGPARRDRIDVPGSLDERLGPPSFRYRGWFINDEDLLTGWAPDMTGQTGISLVLWDRIFETILRLKGNMVIPGTFIFPDEPQVKLAGRRGLIITQHHMELLGLNPYRWDEDKPYSYASHPEWLEAAWEKSVKTYGDQEVIWTVGYRGRHDRPFWMDDKQAGTTDAEHGAVIRKAIEKQMEIVRKYRQQPYFLMNAWDESVDLIQKGALRIPEEVTLVWPDNGFGILRDAGRVKAGEGAYYHTTMANYRSNLLTEFEPPERVAAQLGRFARSGATEYLLVNVSCIRPAVMSTKLVMEIGWNASPSAADPAGESERFYRRWTEEQYGKGAAVAAVSYYQAYFAAPGQYGATPDQSLADHAYHSIVRELLAWALAGKPGTMPVRELRSENPTPMLEHDHYKHGPPPGTHGELPDSFLDTYFGSITLGDFTRRIRSVAENAAPRWDHAYALAESAARLVPPERKSFFQAHALTQVQINRESNRLLIHICNAVEQARTGGNHTTLEELTRGLEAIDQIDAAMKSAEQGKWEGFYHRSDWWIFLPYTRALLLALERKLNGQPLPYDVILDWRPFDEYQRMKAYQDRENSVVF